MLSRNMRAVLVAMLAAFGSLLAPINTLAHAGPDDANHPCTIAWFKPPYVESKAVLTGLIASCDSKPDTFNVDLRVEYFIRGESRWEPRGSGGNNGVKPDPNVTVAAYALDCVTGGWRGHAVVSVDLAGKSYQFDSYSPTTLIGDCEA